MPELRVYALGQLTIEHVDEPSSALSAHKAQALLVYLAVTGRAHSRQALAGLLWSDSPEELARASLRKALSQLRNAFGDHVLADRLSISLDPARPQWVDALKFEAACRRLQDGVPDGTSERSSLRAAVNLYRDGFLNSFPETGAALFDEWTRERGEYYRRLVLEALQLLAEDALGRGELEIGIRDARRALELDPTFEETHRTLICLFAESGNRSAALHQYDECVRILRAELDVDPGESTVALVQKLREGSRRNLVDLRSVPPPVDADQVRSSLPIALTPLVGRNSELASLDELLASDAVRLVSVLGIGGAGKTRLALAAAHEQSENRRYAHGVYLIELEPLETPGQIVSAVAKSVGLSLPVGENDRRSATEQLIDYLRNKELLLILDNIDHVMEGAGLVAELLSQAPRLCILTTSRERLRLPGEHTFFIGGLDFGDPARPLDEPLPPAIRLFVETAQRVVPGYGPSEEELSVIRQICTVVDGIPLGVELAAGWMGVLTAEEIAQQLQCGLDVLEDGKRYAPSRHESMRAVFDSSWQHLSELERTAFAALTVFRGGFTRAAAEGIAGASIHILSALAAKSMLQFDRSRNRYFMHELLRKYGQEKLDGHSEEAERVRRGHGLYFCEVVQTHGGELLGARQQEALSSLEREADNLREAWQWACLNGEWGAVDAAMDGLGRFYEWSGRVRDGEMAFGIAIEGLRKAGDGKYEALYAHAHTWLSVFVYSKGATNEADDLLATAIRLLAPSTADPLAYAENRAFALLRAGIQAYYRDDDKARVSFGQSLAIYERIGHTWGVAQSLTGLAQADADTGDYSTSESSFREALQMHRELGDRRAEAHSLHRMAIMLRNAGKLQESVSLARASYQLNLELANKAGIAWSGQILAECLSSSGEHAEADVLLTQVEKLAADLGYSLRLENIYQERALVLGRLGRNEEAYAKAEQGLVLARSRSHHLRAAWCQGILAKFDLYHEQYERAETRLHEAVTILSKSGREHSLAIMYAFQSMVALALGKRCSASSLLATSLSTSARYRDSRVFLGIMALVAYLADVGRTEEAVAAYGLLRNLSPTISGVELSSTKRRIDPLLELMAPDDVERALSLHRDCDVWDFVAAWIEQLGQTTPL